MKQIIIFLQLFIIVNINSIAQKPQENTTYTDNYLNKFEGNWIWKSGDDTVELSLKKTLNKIEGFDNSYWENILGCHRYVKNGILVESSMNIYDSLQYYYSFDMSKVGVFLYHFDWWGDTIVVKGGIIDISKEKTNEIKLNYLGGNPAQIRMQLSLKGAKISLPGKPYIPGITLPTDIILTKE